MRRAAVVAVFAACLLAGALAAVADQPGEREDLDGAAATEAPHVSLGLYPGLEGAIGAPNVVSWRANGYLTLAVRERFSFFVGYGQDWGPRASSELYTLGWGGVRSVPAMLPQRGFHGKFIRYRRWRHDAHGVHYGLSLGTESGFGPFGLVLEVGAARSDRDHWMPVAQVSVKVGLPLLLPLGG